MKNIYHNFYRKIIFNASALQLSDESSTTVRRIKLCMTSIKSLRTAN